MTQQPYTPFSQRTGLAPVPPQLKVGEVSAELRRLLYYAVLKDLEDAIQGSYGGVYLNERWKTLGRDTWVRFLGRDPDRFSSEPGDVKAMVKIAMNKDIGELFDFVEFIVRHSELSTPAKTEITQAFVEARAAYRFIDGQIVAIGTMEQAAAFEKATSDAEAKGLVGARRHLIEAGLALRNGDWPGAVRESIHSVEAIAVLLAPGETTLGAALREIEKNGHLHGALKSAFTQLYGYTSDEKGVRHALVFNGEAKVDEADALFMIGACASFVSYLLARSDGLEGNSRVTPAS